MSAISPDMRLEIEGRRLGIIAGPATLTRQLPAGSLTTIVTVLRPEATQEATYGTVAVSWVEQGQYWGEVVDVLPSRSERVADVIDIGRRPCRVRLREGSEDVELLAEELTTEGQEA